jgi:hypothetical protein
MANPFPGMNPYLEESWGDVHHRFITYACDHLQRRLPRDLRARADERVFVDSPIGKERSIYPDIRVSERARSGRQRLAAPAGDTAIATPWRVRLSDEPMTQGFIEILDIKSGRRVVTVIEVLSPSNKYAGPGQKLYRKKQKECKKSGVNLVEIDLLRDGPWVLTVPEDMVPESHQTTYHVCVVRAKDNWVGEVYAVPLRERLPTIGIPLRPTDGDVPLDLQAVMEKCYRFGGYDEDFDYNVEPVPPLAPADAVWADALLRKKRRRTGRGGKRSDE